MRRFLALTCVLANVLLAGCGSDSSTAPTPASLVGTWNLSTVNGRSLPFAIPSETGSTVELFGEQLRFDDATFQRETTLRFTEAPFLRSFSDAGSYTLTATGATLTYPYTVGTATFSASTLTIVLEGLQSTTLVYHRQ